jgi:hypothetical protein
MQLVNLPIPPMLLDALGYRGEARFVAVYFGAGDECYYSDGVVTATGHDPHAYLSFVRHPACCLALAPFQLGNSDFEAEAFLILDRQENRAYVAPVAEARRFLREQWNESPATGPVVLSAEEIEAVMDRIRQELDARPLPTPEQVMAALQEQHRLHRELVAWLDATPQAARAREEMRRLVEGRGSEGGEAEEKT